MEVYGRLVKAALGYGAATAFEGFLQVVQRPRDLISEVFALFAENDVLVIGKCQFRTTAEARPQQHRGDMFNGRSSSHTSF